MKKKRQRTARGFSLIEIMIAGAIMMIGLMGILSMLEKVAANTRDGTSAMNGSVAAGEVVEEYAALGYDGLVAQVATDSGFITDYAGRKYGRTVTISGPFTSDGGVPAYQVDVDVAWGDSLGRQHHNLASMVISRAPDGG